MCFASHRILKKTLARLSCGTVVHRGDDACLGWWVRCGHFDITYPLYHEYYRDLKHMANEIRRQNADMRAHWDYASFVYDNLELCEHLKITAPPEHLQAKLSRQQNKGKSVMKNQADYDSSWQWCVDHSRYHFDNSRQDQPGEWFQVLGRFVGDWAEEVAQAHGKPITWATRKFYGNDDDTVSPMLAQEENDLRTTGAPVDLELTDAVFDIVHTLH
jgi:hypothetical protein